MKKNYRNPMTRPENFMNPAGNVMKEIKEADLNNFSAGAGEPRVSDGSQFCTSTKECNWGTIMFVSRGFIIDETNEFEDIVKQILDVKSKHPEWSEQQISDFMDQIHAIKKDGVIDIWNALTSSEKKLVIRYPFDALKVNKAKEIATKQTERKFGKNGLGDRSDAFRHGIWNAEMTVLIGSEKAELFATAHEDKDTTGNESDGYTKDEHKKMDLHNNEIGRKLGADNLSAPEEKMAEIIYDEIMREDSLFVWLHE